MSKKNKLKENKFVSIRIYEPDETKMLNKLVIAMKDNESFETPDKRDVVVLCLKIVSDMVHQENGPQIKPSNIAFLKKHIESIF